MVSNFGVAGWDGVNKDFILHFKENGSGITSLTHLNFEFIYKKISIWLDVGIRFYLLFWAFLILSLFSILKLVNSKYKSLVTSFFLAMIFSFGWYILFSTSGWARHAWQGIMFGILLTSMNLGLIIKSFIKKKRFVLLIVLIVSVFAFFRINSLDFNFFLNNGDVTYWRANRYIRGLEGFPSTPILSLKDQSQLVVFFKKNIKKQDKVYYLGWFLNAEASALVDKVFFPLDRYLVNQSDRSYLIIGPYQQGTWSMMPQSYSLTKKIQLCKAVVFQNDSYTLCKLKTGLIYTNFPYQ